MRQKTIAVSEDHGANGFWCPGPCHKCETSSLTVVDVRRVTYTSLSVQFGVSRIYPAQWVVASSAACEVTTLLTHRAITWDHQS